MPLRRLALVGDKRAAKSLNSCGLGAKVIMDLQMASSWRCSWLAFGDGLFRAGAAPVPDCGYRLALVEPGAG